MITDTLCLALDDNAARAAHVQSLLRALGNPSEWTFNGAVTDTGREDGGRCACGHPIRYLFHIEHTTRGAACVGSTCINHIAEISPELGAALGAARERLESSLAEAKAKAKRAIADAENVRLWNEYQIEREKAIARHRANRAAGIRSPYSLWQFCDGWREKYNRQSPPEYTRACDLKKWITRALVRVHGALA